LDESDFSAGLATPELRRIEAGVIRPPPAPIIEPDELRLAVDVERGDERFRFDPSKPPSRDILIICDSELDDEDNEAGS